PKHRYVDADRREAGILQLDHGKAQTFIERGADQAIGLAHCAADLLVANMAEQLDMRLVGQSLRIRAPAVSPDDAEPAGEAARIEGSDDLRSVTVVLARLDGTHGDEGEDVVLPRRPCHRLEPEDIANDWAVEEDTRFRSGDLLERTPGRIRVRQE